MERSPLADGAPTFSQRPPGHRADVPTGGRAVYAADKSALLPLYEDQTREVLLTELRLPSTGVTRVGAACLGELPSLKSRNLDRNELDDAAKQTLREAVAGREGGGLIKGNAGNGGNREGRPRLLRRHRRSL